MTTPTHSPTRPYYVVPDGTPNVWLVMFNNKPQEDIFTRIILKRMSKEQAEEECRRMNRRWSHIYGR